MDSLGRVRKATPSLQPAIMSRQKAYQKEVRAIVHFLSDIAQAMHYLES